MNAEKIKVLIIDDSPEDREMFIRFLHQHPEQEFHIIESESGIEGLELCKQEQPHCVLIDYQLPDLDGLEFIQSLAEDKEQSYIPVLMLTGQGNEGVASEAMKGGASDYLVKGKLTAEGLYRAVTRAIEKSTLLRTNEKQRHEIERSYRELEQFAYTASHDLQAPLRRITKFLELLKLDLPESLPDRSKDYIERALKGAAHMRALIQDLLDYSVVGGAQNAMEPVNLEEVLKEVLAQLEVMIVSTGSTIDVSELPTVLGNQTFLQQLFQNLIGNAMKFRREPPPIVNISSRRVGTTWIVTVKDNGIGIPSEAFDKVFGIFQRIDNGSQIEGTGIGLALCKKIVELHEGRIWVESTLGEGTAFHFTLPACLERDGERIAERVVATAHA
ncbi:MAG: ATP-binding protein [Nitrospirota bacterium]|nr:ATP-binding protein [Nitrospirota bacterium]MDH5587052.1 ATP-binding protein [Nitrospirota bacterium]MDH5775205.1 ATP-binding protein [Nitrospirota bacterium]